MPTIAKPKKRHRALKAILAVVALLLCAGVACGLWYAATLDGVLGMDSSQESSVNAVLSDAKSGEPFYVLVLGSDSREGSGTSDSADEQGTNQRSDVMMLIRVDQSNRQLTIVSIPRDTPWTAPDGTVCKINEAYNLGGAAMSIQAVSELTGVSISHYAEVSFSDFENVVDALGGITVDVPTALSYEDALTGQEVTLQPGEQTLNGQQAQIFARARHEYGENQDAARQSNVRSVFEALMEKTLDRPLYELPGTILDVAQCVTTDMKTTDLASLAMSFSSGDVTTYSCSGPTDGEEVSYLDGLWLCYRNPDGWSKLMSVVDSGGDPEDLDVSDTAQPW